MARPFAARLGLVPSVPRAASPSRSRRVQPFEIVAGLRFAFPYPTLADVHVVDDSGRRVRTLAAGELGAGEHECGWDGCSDSGERCSPGSYVLRLETGGSLLTSRVVFLG